MRRWSTSITTWMITPAPGSLTLSSFERSAGTGLKVEGVRERVLTVGVGGNWTDMWWRMRVRLLARGW